MFTHGKTIISNTFPSLLKGVKTMSEKKTTYTDTDLKAGLVTLMLGGETIRQVAVSDADSIDLELTITEKKK
jgi:hypothetical protein